MALDIGIGEYIVSLVGAGILNEFAYGRRSNLPYFHMFSSNQSLVCIGRRATEVFLRFSIFFHLQARVGGLAMLRILELL